MICFQNELLKFHNFCVSYFNLEEEYEKKKKCERNGRNKQKCKHYNMAKKKLKKISGNL